MLSRPTQRHRRRWTTAAAVAIALSLSGCGASGPAEFTPKSTVLTKQQARAALLKPSDLGRKYQASGPSDGDSSGMGCLSDDAEVVGPDPAVEVEVNYERRSNVGFPLVYTSVASFSSPDEMAEALEAFVQTIEACPHLKYTSTSGVTFEANITSDNVPSAAAVDEQFNARGVGSISKKKVKLPFGIWMSMARVDNHAVFVMVSDVDQASAQLLNKYTTRAVERLVAVTNDKTPADKKPVPTAESNV